MTPEPPRTFRVARLLAGLALRRWLNRITAIRQERRKRKEGRRGATARKSARSNWVLFLLGPLLLLQAFVLSTVTLDRLDEAFTQPSDKVQVAVHARQAAEHLAPETLAGVGWLVLLLALTSFFNSLGGTSNELLESGWTMEWLFGFPVRARSLMLAKVGEHALTDLLTWLTVWPLLTVTYWKSGFRWWGVPMAAVATLGLGVIVGGARLVAETLLRKRLSASRLKNASALFTLLGLVGFFGVVMIAFRETISPVFLAMCDLTGTSWTPWGLPALVAAKPIAAAVFVAVALLLVWLCVSGAAGLVRTGLVTGGGALQGVRGTAKGKLPGRLGVLGKELLLLGRDRTFLVQTMVTPAFLVGLQAIINPHLFQSAEGGQGGAVAAFAVSCYVLMFGAFSVLAHEKNSLWLLFTFPRSLADLLREKTRVWAGAAMLYGVALLALGWRPGEHPSAATWTAPLFVLSGVYVYAFIAAGFGCLGTDPFAQHVQRRIRPAWSYLFLLVVAMYGYGLSSESIWARLVSLVLAVLMAYAIWQKVAERLALSLDPTARPAPGIALADGLIAVAAFFHLSVAFSGGLSAAGVPFQTTVVVSYAVAGSLTAVIALLIFRRIKVRELGRAIGLVPASGRALLFGVLLGIACAAFAAVYLLVARDWIDSVREQAGRQPELGGAALILLAVVLAPLVEEFIFRGLVFRGMACTLRPRTAILGSALLFAIVHPPISFVPVFAVGVATAFTLKRSGSLWPSVAVHASYNLMVTTVLPRLLGT